MKVPFIALLLVPNTYLLLLLAVPVVPGCRAQQLREAVFSPVEMVVSANGLATAAGEKILAAGTLKLYSVSLLLTVQYLSLASSLRSHHIRNNLLR